MRYTGGNRREHVRVMGDGKGGVLLTIYPYKASVRPEISVTYMTRRI